MASFSKTRENPVSNSLDEFANLCNKLPHHLLEGIRKTLDTNLPDFYARYGIINDALVNKHPSRMMETADSKANP